MEVTGYIYLSMVKKVFQDHSISHPLLHSSELLFLSDSFLHLAIFD
jgi:hypothetical protein